MRGEREREGPLWGNFLNGYQERWDFLNGCVSNEKDGS
jgi:hypothetical protein